MNKKKPNINNPKKQNTKPAVNYFSLLVFILGAILIFYPPFFRGLFFNQDMFIYHSVTALVFLLVCIDKIYRGDYSILRTPLEWAVLAYALAYLLSIIGAVHPGEAVYGFLKALNYFIVFWIISQVVRNYNQYINILRVLFASALGVALIGILAAAGYSKYPAAFEPATGVILSTLQYPNTTAAYLAVASLLGVTLWIVERKLYLRPLYTLANFLMILVVLATMSKGAWLIFILGALLLLLGMPGKYRFSSLYSLLLAITAAAATAMKFLPAIKASQPGAINYLIIGIIIILAGELLWQLLLQVYQRWGKKTIPIIITIFLLLGALTVNQQADRIQKITGDIKVSNLATEFMGLKNVKDSSYTSRTDLYRWAEQIGKDHYLNGTGAGGWNALYHQYQEYLMWTTEVHSHFLQVWVEAGIIGITAFISIWLLLLYIIFRRRQQLRCSSEDKLELEKQRWALNWGVLTAALALGAHAAIDFDLSLGAITILLWTLYALLNSAAIHDGLFTTKTLRQPWILLSAGIILTVLLLVSGQRMLIANNVFSASDALLLKTVALPPGEEKNKNMDELISQTSQAAKLDPFNARCKALQAQALALKAADMSAVSNPDAPEYREKSLEAVRKAGELAPYDIKLRGSLLNTCIILQDYDIMVHQADYLLQANPNDIHGYETAIRVSLAAAEYYRIQGQSDKETQYMQEVVKVYTKLQKQLNKIGSPIYWEGASLFLAPEHLLNVAKAYYLLGNYQQAGEVMEAINVSTGTPPTDPETLTWYGAILYKTGQESEAITIIEPIKQSNPDMYTLYQNLITLQPLK